MRRCRLAREVFHHTGEWGSGFCHPHFPSTTLYRVQTAERTAPAGGCGHQNAGCFSAAAYRPRSHHKHFLSGPAAGQAPEVSQSPYRWPSPHSPGRELGEGPMFSHTTHLALLESFIELRACVSLIYVCVYQYVCAHMYIGRACSLDKYASIQGKMFLSFP